MPTIDLGLDTFGDVTLDAAGRPHSHAHVLRDGERPKSLCGQTVGTWITRIPTR